MVFFISNSLYIAPIAIITFLFIIQPLHEIGHYITAKIYNYRPCGMLFNLCIFPGAVLFLVDIKDTNTIHKLSGLFFPILLFPLFAFLLKVTGFPYYKSGIYWGWYFGLSILSASEDIRIVLEDYLEKEITIPLLDLLKRPDKKAYSCLLITSKEISDKRKEKYPDLYEKRINKEVVLPWS